MIIKSNPEEIQSYLTDASNYKGKCESVNIPADAEELKQLILKSCDSGKRITVSGNGTGLTGGRVSEEGIVLSTEKLNKILKINVEEKYALVEPGVILSDFQNVIEAKGLYYPPDPTEQNCFIGATVATNASGAKSFKYGPTRKFVEQIKVILPTGEFLTIPRGKFIAEGYELKFCTDEGRDLKINIPEINMPTVKHAAGYYLKKGMDLIDLFIGSEGTLGVIVEIKLKLIDKPSNLLSAVIFFDSEEKGLGFIKKARDMSRSPGENIINALGLEFFDGDSLAFLSDDYANIPGNADCAVWFEQDYKDDEEEKVFENWMELVDTSGGDVENSWFATDQSDRQKFVDFRHSISWKVSDYISRVNIRKVGTDLAVPEKQFDEFYHKSKEMAKKEGIKSVAYGHFGDCHLHLNMLPADDNEFNKAKNIYRQLCLLAVSLGGTVSAEHGIGKIKRDYLIDMFGIEKVSQMAKIKTLLDPDRILNIGNLFYEKDL